MPENKRYDRGKKLYDRLVKHGIRLHGVEEGTEFDNLAEPTRVALMDTAEGDPPEGGGGNVGGDGGGNG